MGSQLRAQSPSSGTKTSQRYVEYLGLWELCPALWVYKKHCKHSRIQAFASNWSARCGLQSSSKCTSQASSVLFWCDGAWKSYFLWKSSACLTLDLFKDFILPMCFWVWSVSGSIWESWALFKDKSCIHCGKMRIIVFCPLCQTPI